MCQRRQLQILPPSSCTIIRRPCSPKETSPAADQGALVAASSFEQPGRDAGSIASWGPQPSLCQTHPKSLLGWVRKQFGWTRHYFVLVVRDTVHAFDRPVPMSSTCALELSCIDIQPSALCMGLGCYNTTLLFGTKDAFVCSFPQIFFATGSGLEFHSGADASRKANTMPLR